MPSNEGGHGTRPCWFVGARYDTAGDQTERFVRDGVWEMEEWEAPERERYVQQVKSMRPGDRIAIKATAVRKNRIGFDNKGQRVSVMTVKAVGEITENHGNGHRVKVNWTRLDPPRDWYFYTSALTVWEVTPRSGTLPWAAEALVQFVFDDKPQEYEAFLKGPWSGNYTTPTWDDFIRRARREARVTLPGSKTEFGVPANLHVIGTMNTADRSIALLDTALRRRFVFEEMMPDASHPGVGTNVDGVDCRKLLAAMNRRIAVLLDREHQIGHTYFLGVDTLGALASTFRTRIMPLLQEYFYDDWEKIRAVLNDNGFVRKSDPPEELVRANLVDSDRAVYDLPTADNGRWTSPTAYRAIYETTTEDGSAAPGT